MISYFPSVIYNFVIILFILDKSSSEESNKSKSVEELNFYIDFEKEDKEIMRNSKYKIYYDELILSFKSKMDKAILKPSPKNVFYNPKLFSLIQAKLYLMSLWSGVMIRHTAIASNNEFLKNKTRLDNNPIENHFGHTKTNEYLKRKIYPSEHVIKSYKGIKSKHSEHYSGSKKSNNEIRNSNLAMDRIETWNKGNKTTKCRYYLLN